MQIAMVTIFIIYLLMSVVSLQLMGERLERKFFSTFSAITSVLFPVSIWVFLVSSRVTLQHVSMLLFSPLLSSIFATFCLFTLPTTAALTVAVVVGFMHPILVCLQSDTGNLNKTTFALQVKRLETYILSIQVK